MRYLSRRTVSDSGGRGLGTLVGFADLGPVNDRPQLLKPGLLAPDAILLDPGVLEDRNTEQGVEDFANIADGWRLRRVKAGRLVGTEDDA